MIINNDEDLLNYLKPYKLIPWNCKKFQPIREYLDNRFTDNISYSDALYRLRNKIHNDNELIEYLSKYKRNIPWNSKNLYCVREYLNNRYQDSSSYSESLYRIQHNINIRPTCISCGKPTHFLGFSKGFTISCGNQTCAIKNDYVQNKTKKTCLDRYGTEYSFQSENNKEKSKQTCLNRYGVEYVLQSKEIQEKSKQTCLDRYGVEYVSQYEPFKEKYKQTCLEKYGVDNSWKSLEVRNKMKSTMLLRYGITSTFQDKDIQQRAIKARQTPEAWKKYKQTSIERFGVENYNQTEEAKEKYGVINSFNIPGVRESAIKARQTPEAWEKYKKTSLERYGEEFWNKSEEGRKRMSEIISSKEVQDKINNSKRKNKSFNSSKPEKESYKLLKQFYPDIIQSYRCDRYPFNCDFYIPDLDLFIECNFHWTHGKRPYNPEDEDCKEKLKHWESKLENSEFYKNAINTWTIRDVNKRSIAKENNLNYIEFWNIDELKEWINLNKN